MNLNIKLPNDYDDIAPSETLFSLQFDILNGKYVNGWVLICSDGIYLFADLAKIKFVPFSPDQKEFKVTSLYGSGAFEVKIDNGDVLICHFTKKHMPKFMSLKAAINFYLKTGEVINKTTDKEPFCTKCGRSIPPRLRMCYFCLDKTGIMKRLLSFVVKYKFKMLLIILSTFVTSGVVLLSPYLNRILVDDYLVIKNADLAGILTIVGLMILTHIILMVINIVRNRINAKVGLGITSELRDFAYRKVTSLSISTFNRRSQGEIYNSIMSDTATIKDFLTNNLVGIFSNIVTLFLAAGIILYTVPSLAFWILIPIPFVYVAIFLFQKITRKLYSRQWRQRARSTNLLSDALRGIRVVKSIGNEKREVEKFEKEAWKLADISMKNERLYTTVYPFLNFFTRIGSFAVLFFGAVLVLNKEMTLGELTQFTGYVSMIYGPINWYAYLPRAITNTLTSAARFFELIDEEQDVSDTTEPIEHSIVGNIEFKNITFGYNAFDPVLKDVNLKINAGEMIGLVGKSGVGKSTLANLLMRLYDANSGNILVDGINIKDYSQTSFRSQVGVVLQETFLFAGTIFDNLRYAKQEATLEEVINAAKTANAHDFIMKLPNGYNTKLGERGYTLSGGERQRIAIARAILHNPRILILDEATASLDTETEKLIQDALKKLIEGRTTIAIAHRLSTLRDANRIIVMDKGSIVESGSHHELLAKRAYIMT